LTVSLDCPFLIASFGYSNVYLHTTKNDFHVNSNSDILQHKEQKCYISK